MNWWVIVVETCLNSLHKCLYMIVCWWGLNWCDCLWSLNENWEKWGFSWKMNIMMILMRIDVMIPCLLLFWFPFDVYKLVNKFWERIWSKGIKNEILGWKLEGSREKTQEQGCLLWCSSSGELMAGPWQVAQFITHVFGRFRHSGSIRTVLNWFFWCIQLL
jgi:hypothetical protein